MDIKKWMLAAVVLGSGALAQSSGDYQVSGATLGGGGGTAQGGQWSVTATMGQLSATTQSPAGGGWSVTGGMWPGTSEPDQPPLLFADGFEL